MLLIYYVASSGSRSRIRATVFSKENRGDGEIICLDQHGVSQFNALSGRSKELVFYAFDLLWLDGTQTCR